MFDLKWIREHAAIFDAAMARRGLPPASPEIVVLDHKRRTIQTELQELQARRNIANKAIGRAKRDGGDVNGALADVADIKNRLKELEEAEAAIGSELNNILSGLPNMPFDDVPSGSDEADNIEIRRFQIKRDFDFKAKQHFDIGEALATPAHIGAMDFKVAANLSGSRFVALSGPLAKLERAIGQFMLDLQTQENGYIEMNVPFMVRDTALYGTGNLPKFADDLFKTDTDHFLIPTAEVPLTNLVANQIIPEKSLPLRFAALTSCFRSEAGSAGRDTRGMLRQHQFQKVEMVSVTTPEHALDELERMTMCAEDVLRRLELSYRVIILCAGDMGFGARKTYDIEAWLPGQGLYREISSCSVCGEFQARRMKARYRPEGEKSTRFVHTLNGSGLAVGRTLIAILENYQNRDGSVTIPEVLRPYMNGVTTLGVGS